MLSLKKLIFCISITASQVFGAAEFLPPAWTAEEQEQQARQLQQLIPWSERNSAGFIKIQQNGLESLRRNFPDYDKWAKEKPDPITISIDQKTTVNELAYVLLPEPYQNLQNHVRTKLQKLISENQARTNETLVEKLLDRVYREMGNSLLNGNEAIRGMITGVLQAVPKDKRAEIFKVGDPTAQLKMIRELNISEGTFRQSRFQAERYGMNSQTTTLNDVLSIIEVKINSQFEFLTQLGLLAVLKRVSNQQLQLFNSLDLNKLLLPSDFNFLDKDASSGLSDIHAEIAKRFPESIANLSKTFMQSVAAIPKQWFHKTMASVEVLQPYMKIVEVHPYLGIYRGCLGGDCSTTHSSMYPYSPWEHVFFIQVQGKFVGYVSATRVTTYDETALYLKDVTGRNLTADQAEAVVYAFSKVYPHYGTKKYLLAAHKFTAAENHFRHLIDRLALFNGGSASDGKPQASLVPIFFKDHAIREFIQLNAEFYSGAGYDHPGRHQYGAIFAPRSEQFFKNYAVSYKLETIGAIIPKTSKEALVYALRLLANDVNANISGIVGINEQEVRDLIYRLKNIQGLKLDEFYRSIEVHFKRYDIEMSRSFRQNLESLFMLGHLNSADAFTTQDEAQRNESERYFAMYCRRIKDLSKISEFLERAPNGLSGSKKIADLVSVFASRAEPSDLLTLIILAEKGNVEAQAAIKKTELNEKIENVLHEFIFHQSIQNLGNLDPRTSNLLKLEFALKKGSYPASELLLNIESLLALTNLAPEGLMKKNLLSKKLETKLIRAIADGTGSFSAAQIETALAVYDRVYEKKMMPMQPHLVPLVHSISSKQIQHHEALFAFFKKRVKYLKNVARESRTDAFEAYLIRKIRPEIGAEIHRYHFAPAMMQILVAHLKDQGPPEVAAIEYLRSNRNLGLFPWNSTEFTALYNILERGIKVPIQEIEKYLNELGIGLHDAFKNTYLKSKIQKSIAIYQFPVRKGDWKKADPDFGRALDWLVDLMLSDEHRQPTDILFERWETISNTPEFANAKRRIFKAAREGNKPASAIVGEFARRGLIAPSDEFEISDSLIESWRETVTPIFLIYALYKKIQREPNFVIPQNEMTLLLTQLQILAREPFGKHPMKTDKLREAILDTLLTQKSISSDALTSLRHTFNYEHVPSLALKEVLLYAKAGGQIADIPTLTLQVYMERVAHDKTNRESQRLIAQVTTLSKLPILNRTMTCQTLFN